MFGKLPGFRISVGAGLETIVDGAVLWGSVVAVAVEDVTASYLASRLPKKRLKNASDNSEIDALRNDEENTTGQHLSEPPDARKWLCRR